MQKRADSFCANTLSVRLVNTSFVITIQDSGQRKQEMLFR